MEPMNVSKDIKAEKSTDPQATTPKPRLSDNPHHSPSLTKSNGLAPILGRMSRAICRVPELANDSELMRSQSTRCKTAQFGLHIVSNRYAPIFGCIPDKRMVRRR